MKMIKNMTSSVFAVLAMTLLTSGCVAAQEAPQAPKITMGNGEFNSIQIEGLKREATDMIFSDMRINGANVTTRRGNSTALIFDEVLIDKAGWIVLHPVIDGKPNGDMVSGFAYLNAGLNRNVPLRTDHPADKDDKFLVMLHSDVDEDHVFDFVFVEDGINVEDKAVFEGSHMIAHIISVP